MNKYLKILLLVILLDAVITVEGSDLIDKTMDCMEKLNNIELNKYINRLGEIGET